MSVFFDTNVLVYAFTADPKQGVAQMLLADGGTISSQVLNEFTCVARGKHKRSWGDIEAALDAVRLQVDAILPLTAETHASAVALARDHGFSFFDALIVAAALEAKCTVLMSEDFQHGRQIGNLRIQNPFI